MDDLSFELPRNGIVGVIGPNGVGKSTLFKMIMGIEQPTSGSLKLGETVKVSYVDQGRAGIDGDKNVWEVVSDGLDYMMVCETEVPEPRIRGQLRLQGFRPAETRGRALGWRAQSPEPGADAEAGRQPAAARRAHQRPGRRDACPALEEALLRFPGCAVVTSHDRMFLDRVATHILAWEGTDENPGNWHWFEGNFESYQKNRIERLGEEAAKPHRLHRKLTRD